MKLNDIPLHFGKYRGQTPNQVAAIDPQYIVWIHAAVLPSPCTRELALDCEERCSGLSSGEDGE